MSSNNPLIITKDSCNIIIDTGRKSSWKSISEKLDKMLGENSLNAVILTHAHYDHVENTKAIKEKYNAKIIIHKSEAVYLQKGESSPLPAWKYSMGERINQLEEYKKYYPPVEPDILINDYLDLGEYGVNAYVINTPGHTMGSITIVINDEVAVIGDATVKVTKKPFEKKLKKISKEAMDSWEKLIRLNCKYYITSHNGIMEHKNIADFLIEYKMIMK
jgi:glyoxylase-like metal-dependent hydrolase (beta-lactamase superfamily II)